MALKDRHIPLTGSKNFRDFGGYPTRCGSQVKRGLLFRSDGLWKLSDEDLATLSPLGIQNICDLRRSREREMMPTRWHEDTQVKNIHLPLMPEGGPSTFEQVRVQRAMTNSADSARQVMIDLYRAMVSEDYALDNLRKLLLIVASEEELPVLIHCSGGKDRTGISCALILSLLGVDKADVMEDYMRSQTLYSDKVDLQRAATQVFDHSQSGEWSAEAVRPVYNVDPAYLDSALSHIVAQHGDVERFVRQALGLGDEEIQRIRKNLIA